MKTDLKTTDPEYIEALARNWANFLKHLDEQETKNCITDYSRGAKDILSHTNHAEVVEAAKRFLEKKDFESKLLLIEALTKSETSKL